MTMDPTQPVAPETSPSLAPSAPMAPVAPVVAVSPRPRSGGVLNLLLIGAAVLAVGGVAFAIGRSTAPASAFPGVGGLNGGPIVRSDGSFDPARRRTRRLRPRRWPGDRRARSPRSMPTASRSHSTTARR